MNPSEHDMTPQASTSPRHPEPQPALFEGWHDSSLDLKRGLVVTEHGAFDPLADVPALQPASAVESLTRWIRPRS
jgi:hypothetical protein